MKNIFLAIAALLICFSAGARTPKITWNETTHDFGAFDEGVGPVTCDFIFTNGGSESVSVVSARASCGCTAPRFSLDPVAPGQSGVISVTYDPQGRPGRFNKYVSVKFSDDAESRKLYVVGTVVGDEGSLEQRYPVKAAENMRFNRGVAMFGDVDKGHMRHTFINAYNAGHDTLRPAVVAKPDFIEWQCVPAAVPPGEQVGIALYFYSDRTPLYGLVSDSIAIAPNPGAEAMTFPIVALVREDFSRLTPNQLKKAPVARLASKSLDFGRLERTGEPVTKSVELFNDGKNKLEIRRIYTTDPGVEVSVDRKSVKKGKSAVVTVTVDPSALPGALLNARINIITNDPTAPVLTLRAVAELL